MKEFHLKLKFKGNPRKLLLFNHILANFDRDWPLRLTNPPTCDVCGGVIYRAPRFNPEHLIGLARQIADTKLIPGYFKLKIKRFCTREVCEKERTESRAGGIKLLTA